MKFSRSKLLLLKKRGCFFDDSFPTFGLRVHATKKTFILCRRQKDGRKKQFCLGHFPFVSIAEAKEKAKKIINLETGKPESRSKTVKELSDFYLQNWANKNLSLYEDKRRIEKRILPAIGNVEIKKLSIAQVHSFFLSIKAPIEANHCLNLLSTIINITFRFQLHNAPNPCLAIKRNPKRERSRFFSVEEAINLVTCLDKIGSLQSYAIKILLHTGCRKLEILELQWCNVDLEKKEIYLLKTKAKKPRFVPLTNDAIKVFERIPRDSEFVFPSPVNDKKPLHDVRKTWSTACKMANLENAKLHDLRRTVGSLLACAGVSLPIIAKTLGHTTAHVTHVYARISQEVERECLERIEQTLNQKKPA